MISLMRSKLIAVLHCGELVKGVMALNLTSWLWFHSHLANTCLFCWKVPVAGEVNSYVLNYASSFATNSYWTTSHESWIQYYHSPTLSSKLICPILNSQTHIILPSPYMLSHWHSGTTCLSLPDGPKTGDYWFLHKAPNQRFFWPSIGFSTNR